jgi:hypothetical protein
VVGQLKHIVGTEQTPGGAKESFNVVTIHPARQDHPTAAGEGDQEEGGILAGK